MNTEAASLPDGATSQPAGVVAIEPGVGRLRSLDVFRGATIAGMILVNNAGDWGHDVLAFAPRALAWVDAHRSGVSVFSVHRRGGDSVRAARWGGGERLPEAPAGVLPLRVTPSDQKKPWPGAPPVGGPDTRGRLLPQPLGRESSAIRVGGLELGARQFVRRAAILFCWGWF